MHTIYKKILRLDNFHDKYKVARRATIYILALNFILFLAKCAIGLWGNSFALFADGINNLADMGTSFAMYFALRFASRPPDEEHAYGHGKIETEIARIMGLVVMVTAGGIIVGGFQNLSEPQDMPGRLVLITAVLSILVKEHMFRFQHRLAVELSSRSLEADAVNHRTDVVATMCVLIGTIIVFLGGQAYAPVDDVAAILVGVVMAFAAGRVVLSSTQDMLDAMPPEQLVQEVREVVASIPGIVDTEKILGRKMGMYYNIDLHIEVDKQLKVQEAHYIGHQAAELLEERVAEVGKVLVHIEPYFTPEERQHIFDT